MRVKTVKWVEMSTEQNKYILAIDLGTSGPKVALISTRGEVVDWEFEKTSLHLLPNGGVEQSPDDWWAAIKKASQRLIGKKLVEVDDIAAISCTGQWSGTVAVDAAGQHLANAIIWMDARGLPYVKQILNGFLKIEGYDIRKALQWLRLTGGLPAHSGKDSIAHILFVKNELPEVYKNTYKFLEPKDYLNMRLSGQFAASFDSIALHWVTDNRNISDVRYSPRLLRLAGLDPAKLPDMRQAIDVLGPIKPAVARELGLREDVRIIVGTPDVQSAAIGSGAVRDYEAHLYIGTSSWLTCHVPYKKTDLFHKMASLPSAIPGRYFVANEQETAGACLTFLKDNILFPKDPFAQKAETQNGYEMLDRIAESVAAGSQRVIVAPWLNGERTPVEDASIRGGIHNLSLRTTRDHLVRATFEGVAYNSRWLLGYVEKFVKRQFETINMIGGGAHSDVWCQIHADVLDRTIAQVKDPIQANVRGAAFLASVALGSLSFDDIPERVEIANTFRPNPDHRQIYDELFEEFVHIYKSNRRIYARLNKAL